MSGSDTCLEAGRFFRAAQNSRHFRDSPKAGTPQSADGFGKPCLPSCAPAQHQGTVPCLVRVSPKLTPRLNYYIISVHLGVFAKAPDPCSPPAWEKLRLRKALAGIQVFISMPCTPQVLGAAPGCRKHPGDVALLQVRHLFKAQDRPMEQQLTPGGSLRRKRMMESSDHQDEFMQPSPINQN